jgi:hypothetical protein
MLSTVLFYKNDLNNSLVNVIKKTKKKNFRYIFNICLLALFYKNLKNWEYSMTFKVKGLKTISQKSVDIFRCWKVWINFRRILHILFCFQKDSFLKYLWDLLEQVQFIFLNISKTLESEGGYSLCRSSLCQKKNIKLIKNYRSHHFIKNIDLSGHNIENNIESICQKKRNGIRLFKKVILPLDFRMITSSKTTYGRLNTFDEVIFFYFRRSVIWVMIICSKFVCSKNLLDTIFHLLDTIRAIIFFFCQLLESS